MVKLTTLLTTVGAGIASVALGLTAFNIATWPRGRTDARLTPRPDGTDSGISILIPARNEEETIEACVRAALRQTHPVAQVIVYDDGSTDRTSEIVDQLAHQEDRLTRIDGRQTPLGQGWIGKPHACHQLARHAQGDLLLFVDADTFLTPQGCARIASMVRDLDADVVTAVPRQRTASSAERLILPLLHLTYTSWFPLILTYLSDDERFLAANGQILAVRRETYDAIGGFESVKGEVVDDMAFCGLAKRSGARVVFADGFAIATCRMYGSAREVIEGFSKNIYEGLGASPVALAGVVGLYTTGFILPYLAAVASWRRPELRRPALIGVGANVALRAILSARFRHAPEGIVLHPIAVVGLMGIALNSARWHRAGRITWSGRTYDTTFKQSSGIRRIESAP